MQEVLENTDKGFYTESLMEVVWEEQERASKVRMSPNDHGTRGQRKPGKQDSEMSWHDPTLSVRNGCWKASYWCWLMGLCELLLSCWTAFSFSNFCLICDKVSRVPDWSWPHCVSEDNFELLIHLSLSSNGWGYLCAIPHLVFCSVGDQTQRFMHSRQALHQLSHISSPKEKCFVLGWGFCFLRGPGSGVLRQVSQSPG